MYYWLPTKGTVSGEQYGTDYLIKIMMDSPLGLRFMDPACLQQAKAEFDKLESAGVVCRSESP